MTKKITFCGMCTALSVVIALMTGLFPYNTVFLICAATALFPLAKIKCGTSYAFISVAASALVAFMLMGEKIFWVGYTLLSVYAVFKGLIESLNKIWLEIMIKILLYAAGACVFMFMYPWKVFLGLAAAGVAVFLVYDVALSMFIGYMRKKLRFFE